MKRRHNESFEDYKARRAAANKASDEINRRGFVVYGFGKVGVAGRPYNKAEEARKEREVLAKAEAERKERERLDALHTGLVLVAYICQFIVNPQEEQVSA